MATVAQALEYYDQGQEKYAELYDKLKYYKVVLSDSDQKRNRITFFDADMQLIFESDFELIGELVDNVWSWSWSHANNKKMSTYLMRKLIIYALDLEYESKLPESLALKHLLLTNNHTISKYTTVEIFLALYAYLLKMQMITKLIVNPRFDEIIPWINPLPTETSPMVFINILNYTDASNLGRINSGSVSSIHT